MSAGVNQDLSKKSVAEALSVLEVQAVTALSTCPFLTPDMSPQARESVMAIMSSLVPNIRGELSSLPTYHQPLSAASQPNQLTCRLKVMKPMLNALVSMQGVEGLGEQGRKELSHTIKHMMWNFFSISSEEVLSSSAPFQDWFEEIVSIQEIFSKYLEAPSFPEGRSKGILYKIKKEGKTYGYALGTFHYALTPEMQEATKLVHAIYKKLCKCMLIGTEIKIPLGHLSVEGQLISVAQQQAIVSFGIDTPERNKIIAGLKESQKESMSLEKKQAILKYVSKTVQAYREGNREVLAEDPPKEMAITAHEELELEALRNKVMAENIDAILTASIQVKRDVTRPRSFFAIGSSHLLCQGNVLERLKQMGWEVVAVD